MPNSVKQHREINYLTSKSKPMKKDESTLNNFEHAIELSKQIQEKCLTHKALSVAIGAIHTLFAERDKSKLIGIDDDINSVPVLVEMSLNLIKEIDSMTDELELMMTNLKNENTN